MKNLWGLLAIILSCIVIFCGCTSNKSKDAIIHEYKPSNEALKALAEVQKFSYNKDYVSRDKILKLNVDWQKDKTGGIKEFEEIDVKTFETLLVQKYIDPSDSQNESPTAKEFFQFMCKYPSIKAYGYAVSPKRNDYRVTIEGIYVLNKDITPNLKKDFMEFCKSADEISTDEGLSSWWD